MWFGSAEPCIDIAEVDGTAGRERGRSDRTNGRSTHISGVDHYSNPHQRMQKYVLWFCHFCMSSNIGQ